MKLKITSFHLVSIAAILIAIWMTSASASPLHIAGDQKSSEETLQTYLDAKGDNTDRWMYFMAIISTVFAVFFVYSGFKIDDTVKKVIDAENKINNITESMKDIHEYTVQLEYCMSFIVQKQYDKAIDALEVLRKEPFVWKDSGKSNTCNFFLAHCFYERGLARSNLEDLALAVQYINDAIPDDAAHPFKIEITRKFQEFDAKNTPTS